ncbi:N-acetyltransferase family protein [Flavitalea flava]
MFTIRPAQPSDKNNIMALYKKVAEDRLGIAREVDEVTEEYVQDFMDHAREGGIELVVDREHGSGNTTTIIAEIHCYPLTPRILSHVLGELTIAVHPDSQGKGVGKAIFQHLLNIVSAHRPDILRVELITRESNLRAIQFYEKLGFRIEGRLENRISTANKDGFEADIPMGWINKNYTPDRP